MVPDGADLAQQLARVNSLIEAHSWLPPPEEISNRIPRSVLLAGKEHAGKGQHCWSAMPVEEVYDQVPERLELEEARALHESKLRLSRAKSLRGLRNAVKDEMAYAAGTAEMQEAKARLAELQGEDFEEETSEGEGSIPGFDDSGTDSLEEDLLERAPAAPAALLLARATSDFPAPSPIVPGEFSLAEAWS